MHSNHILLLHANIAQGEALGGTYGVCGEKRTWYNVGYVRLDVNERVISVVKFMNALCFSSARV